MNDILPFLLCSPPPLPPLSLSLSLYLSLSLVVCVSTLIHSESGWKETIDLGERMFGVQ